MKRITFFSLALICACGGNDEISIDASADQTTDTPQASDAPNDVVGTDAGGTDATLDSPSKDVIVVDVVPDKIVIDAPVDAITTSCANNNQCPLNDFCNKGTGNCNGTGKCTLVPQFCNQLYNPVCGCDKKTYTNECYAGQASVSVAYAGVCE